MKLETIKKAMRVTLMTVATMSSGSLFQAGCGTGGYDYGGYDYGGYDYGGYGGYGGIDPDVFQTAADNWDSYIRE